MKRKISTVFFDAGNTLLYLDYHFIMKQLEMDGVMTSIEKVKRAEYASRRYIDETMAAGKISDKDIWPVYFHGILRISGLENDVVREKAVERIREKNDYFGLWTHVPDEVKQTLSGLREKGFKIGIISNSDGSLKTLLENTGVDKMVDFALDSFVVGHEKPDPRIFQTALLKAGAQPEECVHVGDIYAADVLGARGVGIFPILLDPFGEKPADCRVISSISETPAIISELNT